jgi:hypothetical protein
MSLRSVLFPGAIVAVALITSSLQPATAQQPATPAGVQAAQEQLLVGPAAPTLGTLGVNTKTYSAVIGSDGRLLLAPAGSSSFAFSAGVYEVDFPSDISKCVYTATVGDTPAGFPGPGIVVVTPRAGIVNGIFVRTFAPGGAVEAHPFHIQVQC